MSLCIRYLLFSILAWLLIGCSGFKTFPNTVRVGETAVVAAGMMHHFARDNITVTITPTGCSPVVFPPGSPDVRSSVNLYPDPLSSLVVSDAANYDVTPYGQTYADQVKINYSGGNKDFWQSIVFVNIPTSLTGCIGPATVYIDNPDGESVSAALEIVSGAGLPEAFEAAVIGPLNGDQLLAMERLDHYVVTFAGTGLPAAIQLDLERYRFNGQPINSRAETKNLNWSRNGLVDRIILTPVNQTVDDFNDFKFYVAVRSGNSSLATLTVVPNSVLAFDVNGNPVGGVTPQITLVRGAGGFF